MITTQQSIKTNRTTETERRLTMYREAEIALREFFSANTYCLENCITQEFSKFSQGKIPGRLGCCRSNYFEIPCSEHLSYTAEEFEKLQKANAICRNHQDGECDYHSETGCTIKAYLNPICLGFICPSYSQYLRENFKVQSSGKIRKRLVRIIDGIEINKDFNDWLARVQEATVRVKREKENQDANQGVIEI